MYLNIYVESIIKTHDGHVFSFMSLWLLSWFVIPNIQAHFPFQQNNTKATRITYSQTQAGPVWTGKLSIYTLNMPSMISKCAAKWLGFKKRNEYKKLCTGASQINMLHGFISHFVFTWVDISKSRPLFTRSTITWWYYRLSIYRGTI